jgi:hypothetical protein
MKRPALCGPLHSLASSPRIRAPVSARSGVRQIRRANLDGGAQRSRPAGVSPRTRGRINLSDADLPHRLHHGSSWQKPGVSCSPSVPQPTVPGRSDVARAARSGGARPGGPTQAGLLAFRATPRQSYLRGNRPYTADHACRSIGWNTQASAGEPRLPLARVSGPAAQ